MFILNVTNRGLTVPKGEALICGSVNSYPVKFIFGADWDGVERWAVFKVGSEVKSQLLDEENACQIPWELLKRNNLRRELMAGVYGTIGGEVVLPTEWAKLGIIQPGAELGESALPPTPSLTEQILQQTVSAAARAEAAAQRAEDAAAGGGGAGGTGNVSSPEIRAIKVIDRGEFESLTERPASTMYVLLG